MSIVAFLWLIVSLLFLAAIYFGLKWLADFLKIEAPDVIWKILAAILVIIGVIKIVIFLGAV